MNTPAPKPPIVHTHRGKPRTFTIEGYHAATKPDRTPTHRKPGPPIVPSTWGGSTGGSPMRDLARHAR